MARARSTKLPGIGDPAAVQRRKLLASWTSGSYASSKVCRNVVAETAAVQRNWAMRAKASTGSHASMM